MRFHKRPFENLLNSVFIFRLFFYTNNRIEYLRKRLQHFQLSHSQLIQLILAIFGCSDCSTAQSSRIVFQNYIIGPLAFGFRVFVIQTRSVHIVLFMHSQLYYLGFAVVALFFILHLILWFSMSTFLLCKHVQFFVFVCLGKWQKKKERIYNTILWVGN